MKLNWRYLMQIAATGVVFAAPAWSQVEPAPQPRREVFFEVGGSFYTGNTGRADPLFSVQPDGSIDLVEGTARSRFSKAGRGFAGFRYWVAEGHAVEASFSYSPNILRFTTSHPPVSTGESVPVQLRARNVAFNYVRAISGPGRLRLFFTAGAGIGVFDGLEQVEKKFVINFGIGADVPITQRVFLRTEFRDFFSAQPAGGGLQAPGGATHNLVPSAGLAFRF